MAWPKVQTIAEMMSKNFRPVRSTKITEIYTPTISMIPITMAETFGESVEPASAKIKLA